MNNASKHVLWLLASVEEATPRQLESLAEWLAFVKSCVTPEVAKHLHAACVAHVAHVRSLAGQISNGNGTHSSSPAGTLVPRTPPA